ncbi:MAG: hypothetical protein L3J65_11075 [Robiginitomaculum sp.]|nr:hypothetical protein [Robiginitomaculum sp.]
MTKVIPNPHPTDGTEYLVSCPGCGCEHWFRTSGAEPNWHFDGNLECPTVTPSLLVQGQHRCHSFITNGKWIYLQDCTHDLAGQTVPIPKYDEVSP